MNHEFYRYLLFLSGDRSGVLEITDYPTDALGLFGRWRFIVCDAPVEPTASIIQHGPLVLSNWLQDIARRKYLREPIKGSLAGWLLNDLADWVGRNGGDSEVVRKANVFLDDMQEDWLDASRRLVRVAQGALERGDLELHRLAFPVDELCRLGTRKRRPKSTTGVFVSEKEIGRALKAQKCPHPYWRELVPPPPHIICRSQAVIPTDHKGERGWVFSDHFWRREVEKHAKAGRRRRRTQRSLLRQGMAAVT
jgi:hypothetical protein